jgi:2-dehydropantoate 2-reductase
MSSTACIYGVGAIGGYLAAKLAQSGVSVTGISRGPQLRALQSAGLTLVESGKRITVRLRAVERAQDAGEQDVVFLTMKAHVLPGIAGEMRPLLKAGTAVITVGNGFPWWYFYRPGTAAVTPTLPSVDPRGALWRLIGPEHALGCVVYPAARLIEPGVIEHVYGNRFSVGEPDGAVSERVQRIAGMLNRAGLDAPVRQDIRTELWTKLAANVAYNPVSVLTGTTLGQMIHDPALSSVLESIMLEAMSVAAAFDVKVPLQPRQLMELTRPLAAHKTSMLLDLEAGRSIEIDPTVGAVAELARLKGIKTPVLDAVLALTRQRAKQSARATIPTS